MLKRTFLFSILLFSLRTYSQSSKENELKQFPRYSVVVDSFFSGYGFTNTDEKRLTFARMPDGWYVLEVAPMQNDSVLKKQLFWSLAKKEFVTLTYAQHSLYPDKKEYHTFLLDYYFDRIPYYGYNGWAEDVVKDFDGAGSLSDTTLEGLARAHGNLALFTVDNRYGTPFPARKTPGTGSKEQTFRLHAEKEIESYMRLKKQNPRYETFVGDVDLKIGNSIMSYYFEMQFFGKAQEVADKYFQGHVYDKFYIALAKNYLICCAPNGVLFTNGDTDTYPLWYVQDALGFRPDVLVVNLSLLNLPRYLPYIKKRTAQTLPLKTTIPDAKYAGDKLDFAYVLDSFKTFVPLQDALLKLASDQKTDQLQNGDLYYPCVYSKNLQFKCDRKKIKQVQQVPPYLQHDLLSEVKWTLRRNYLLRSEIITFDLLANNSDRPFYFTSTTGSDAFAGLDNCLISRGMTYAFLPHVYHSQHTGIEYDETTTMDLLMGQLQLDSIVNSGSDNYNRLCGNYRSIYFDLANQFMQEKKVKEATLLVNRIMLAIPINPNFIDRTLPTLVYLLYKMNDNARADSLLQELANDAAKLLRSGKLDGTDRKDAIDFLGSLYNMAAEYSEGKDLKTNLQAIILEFSN